MQILPTDLVTYLSYGLLTAHREVKDVLKAHSNSLQENTSLWIACVVISICL